MKRITIKICAAIAILVISISILLFIIKLRREEQNKDIFSINLKEHKNSELHIHPFLEIEILGKQQTIPANIGISSEGMRVIHTHDSSGKLHIESPYPHQFYLKDFFTVWGKRLTSKCIFEFCEDNEHKLRFFINGAESDQSENISLRDLDIIKISYEKR